MNKYKYLNLIQLDKKVKNFINFEVPEKGWINIIRNSLDISLSYLAKKLNTSRQVANIFEQNEVEGAITLNTLKNVAEAMDCNLVYAFVPKDGSFLKLVENKAERIANHISSRTSSSMNLEMQSISKSEAKRQKKQLINEMLENNLKKLWKYEV